MVGLVVVDMSDNHAKGNMKCSAQDTATATGLPDLTACIHMQVWVRSFLGIHR